MHQQNAENPFFKGRENDIKKTEIQRKRDYAAEL